MNVIDAIYARRAVKHFDPTHRLSDTEIDQLFRAAIQSPTSFNMQNWRFVLVQDPSLRKEIRAASYDQAQVTDASLLVILTADLDAYRKEPKRYWQNAPKEVNDLLSGWMVPFYEGKPELKRDEAMRSVGIAGQTLMLAAKGMGLDSCPMIGFEADKVAALIRLPKDHALGFMITIGKATKPAWPKPGQLPMDAVLVHDRFPATTP